MRPRVYRPAVQSDDCVPDFGCFRSFFGAEHRVPFDPSDLRTEGSTQSDVGCRVDVPKDTKCVRADEDARQDQQDFTPLNRTSEKHGEGWFAGWRARAESSAPRRKL